MRLLMLLLHLILCLSVQIRAVSYFTRPSKRIFSDSRGECAMLTVHLFIRSTTEDIVAACLCVCAHSNSKCYARILMIFLHIDRHLTD